MKLLGFIEVFDYVNSNCLSRSKHSTITIGNFKDASVLLLQTPSNKSGTRYEIENNILRVFQRFLKDGKATIRLKVPSHELRLVNEPIQLKSFLTVLRSCFKEPGSILPTLTAKPKFTKAPPKKAVINSTDHLEQLDKLSLKLTELQIQASIMSVGMNSSINLRTSVENEKFNFLSKEVKHTKCDEQTKDFMECLDENPKLVADWEKNYKAWLDKENS